METTELARRETEIAPLSAGQIRDQVNLIQEVMRGVMQEGQHYGKIPGCGDKPTLLKPGAEKLALTFRLAPAFQTDVVDMSNGHREYRIVCTLTHIGSGDIVGQGVGSCSTMETKFRYRTAERVCPKCGKPTIIKGKAEYGGGFICFAKKGGCGAKFADNDESITGQQIGRAENPDIADTYNTVLKMAKKRAQVDATLTATAASDIFTQDIEDFHGAVEGEIVEPAKPQTKPQEKTPGDYEAFRVRLEECFDAAGWDENKREQYLRACLAKIKKQRLEELDAGERAKLSSGVMLAADKERKNAKPPMDARLASV